MVQHREWQREREEGCGEGEGRQEGVIIDGYKDQIAAICALGERAGRSGLVFEDQ